VLRERARGICGRLVNPGPGHWLAPTRGRVIKRFLIADRAQFHGRRAFTLFAPMPLRARQPFPSAAMIANEDFFSHPAVLLREFSVSAKHCFIFRLTDRPALGRKPVI
jgi:hypothetical protein